METITIPYDDYKILLDYKIQYLLIEQNAKRIIKDANLHYSNKKLDLDYTECQELIINNFNDYHDRILNKLLKEKENKSEENK